MMTMPFGVRRMLDAPFEQYLRRRIVATAAAALLRNAIDHGITDEWKEAAKVCLEHHEAAEAEQMARTG